jgi:pimeloyl-ACP methyl ester carboxylesterase
MDSGMWDGFELPGEVVRHDLEGNLADTVGGEPAALVGASYGGLVCLDFAARHPELVTALVLLDAPLPDHEESDDLLAYAEEEERLYEEGKLEEATDLNLSYWGIPDRYRAVVRRSLEYDVDAVESVDLRAVTVPVLVLVGELDKPDFRQMAERLARELPNAEYSVIPGAGHLPSMERTAETLGLVRAFLSGR